MHTYQPEFRMTRQRTPIQGTAEQLIERARAVDDLRSQLVALETEIARIEQERVELRARNQPTEERTMAAIRTGDEYSAKTALGELQAAAEIETLLDADLTVLRALAAECRDFLAAFGFP